MFAYEAASAKQVSIDFDGSIGVSVDIPGALKFFDELIERFKVSCNADHAVVALSSPTRRYWRHDIWPTYKEHRAAVQRPQALSNVREHILEKYQTVVVENLEADDVLGILATSDRTVKGWKVIVSTDKDMKQIPGWIYNPSKQRKPSKVTEEAADRWHLYQTLVGDATDNYPGCPRIGPVKAEKILSQPDQWAAIEAAFVKAGKTKEDTLVQARVSRILRASDWDRVNKKVRLWTPNTESACSTQ